MGGKKRLLLLCKVLTFLNQHYHNPEGVSLSAFGLLTGIEPSAVSCACVDAYIFWHVIPHPFQTSNFVFHYSSQGCLCSTPQLLSWITCSHALWSSCIRCVELSSLIHFAQRHYLYPYTSPAEGSQLRNFCVKDSLLDKNKQPTTTRFHLSFFQVLFLHVQYFIFKL